MFLLGTRGVPKAQLLAVPRTLAQRTKPRPRGVLRPEYDAGALLLAGVHGRGVHAVLSAGLLAHCGRDGRLFEDGALRSVSAVCSVYFSFCY